MALEQRLNLKQTLQLRMTPQLRQAIKILQVSRAELETIIGEELSQNPTLEELAAEEVEAPAVELRTGDPEASESEAVETPAAPDKDAEAPADISNVDWEGLSRSLRLRLSRLDRHRLRPRRQRSHELSRKHRRIGKRPDDRDDGPAQPRPDE
jgi:RNA polymerase sigma-54 factor